MSDEPKPPTDAELDEMEASLHWAAAKGGDLEPPHVSARLALQLVAEIRRLPARLRLATNGQRAAEPARLSTGSQISNPFTRRRPRRSFV
jgi:hypothetical protein